MKIVELLKIAAETLKTMSDSSQTIEKYVDMDTLFSLVHDLAVDKLKDEDEKFLIKSYFNVVS